MRIDIGGGKGIDTTAEQDDALAWLARAESRRLTAERDAANPPAQGEVRPPVPFAAADYARKFVGSALASYVEQHGRAAVGAKASRDLADPAARDAAKAELP